MLVPECGPEAEREPGVYTDGASKAIREQAEAERGIVIQFRVARRVAGSQAQEEFNFSPLRHGVHDDARRIPSGLRGETGHDRLRGMAVPAMIQNLTDL